MRADEKMYKNLLKLADELHSKGLIDKPKSLDGQMSESEKRDKEKEIERFFHGNLDDDWKDKLCSIPDLNN